MYEIRTRKVGTTDWQGYFDAKDPAGIVSLASQLPGYELKVSTVGHAIETIHHPHKGCMVQDILSKTNCMAPCDAPYDIKVYGWERDANEAVIRWTFDQLVTQFKIDTITVDHAEKKAGRVRYTIRVVR